MKYIPNKVSQSVARSILQAKKQSPHIFFVGGVVGVVGAAVLACRATLKLEETVEEITNDLSQVKALKDDFGREGNNYTEQNYHKDVAFVYGKSVGKVAKLYGPSIVVGGISIAALTGSHIQLTKRNTALTVTLAAVSKAYEEYRVRVREEVGAERELEIHRNLASEKELKEAEKHGLTKVTNPTGFSPYAKFFDEACPSWQKDPELNRIFITCQQNYANQRLLARGHVFLNEVYESLGIDHTRAGAVVGWVIGDEGDNYIDFGMFEPTSSRFINGEERSIILDFNVDGVIYDKI